jgi:thioredoxin-related protein
MRHLLLLLFILLALRASDITWQSDYAAAQQRAQQNGKKIFVMISTPECTWCRKLEATTLSDPTIIERLEKEYASVHVTRDVDAYPKELEAVVTPMCYFLAADGTVIDYARGYWGTDDFNLILSDVNKRLTKMKEQE